MAKGNERSLDQIEADYRKALDKYEQARGPVREQVLDLRRERDARLEEMSDTERDVWERAHMPAATDDD
jgi:hypothetical protein